MYSRTKQKDLLEHLLSKSKEEFILEYTSYDETTTRDVWVAILAELKNAVIFSNIQRLKALKKLSDYINSTNNVKLGTYYNHSELNNTNLVILACKHNAQKSLQYLFNNCDFLKNIHCTLSPCDEDEVHHNAFYYAIRSNNVKILQKLIEEWPGIISQEIDEVISQAYEELKLKNVDLSNETEALVVDTLINVRFYTDESFDEKNAEITIGDIQERIDLLLENIDFINEYLNAEIDETFLYTAKFIAKNIHILKRYLKSTYDRLPWEEIEFCLVTFINSSTKQEETNLLYKSVLTKENILCYLCNFALILKDVKVFIANANVNNLRRLPSLKRSNIIESIIQNNLSFKALYDNYTEIIDVYSLNRMKYYTDLAMSANSTKKEEQFIIIRALQVIAEFMKNTLESPKLSNSTSEILLQSLRKDTRQIVTNLRNSLSHSNSLYRITQIESNAEISFFTNIQNDIKKINTVITEILYKLKIKRLRTLLKVIVDSSSLNEIREVVEVFRFINFNDINLQIKTPVNYHEVEELIDNLSEKIGGKTSDEIEYFNEIREIIKNQTTKLKDNPYNYLHELSYLQDCTDEIDINEVRNLKCLAENILERIRMHNESYNFNDIPVNPLFKDIVQFLRLIFASVNSRMDPDDNSMWKLISYFEKLLHTFEFEMDSILWVERLKDKLKENYGKYNYAENEEIITDKQFAEQLTQKYSVLENVLNENSGKLHDKKIQAILEMVLLDIMSILGSSENSLNENLLYLDDNLPLLTGKNLRDHLAHGNILTDILPVNPATTILSNIAKITKDNITQVRKIGKIIAHDSLKLKKLHEQNLETTIIQKKMFTAIAEGNFEEIKICIQNGGEVKGRTTNLWTSLHFAAKQSNLEIVKFLLDQNLNIGTKDLIEQSALHIAAVYGNKDFIEFFLENKKIFIDDTDINNRTLLHYAAQNGHKEIIELLNKNKARTTIKDTNGFSPLHYAIFNGRTDSAKMLIKREKNVETNQTKDGCTALHIASKRGHIDIVNFLLEKKANVNAKNKDGDIPLHKAAASGHLEVAKVLILKGADVNTRGKNGSTPLHLAVESNRENIFELLIKHKADINVIDKLHLNTPLSYAAYFGFKRIVEILLKNKANVNIDHTTPLHLAASKGHLDIVRLLLNSNAEINRENTEGWTALHLSANNGHVEVVKFLLKNKCNLNARDNNKRTPLHVAITGGNKEIVKLLLLEGADANSEDVNNYTALHFCAITGNEDITKILVEIGAKVNVRNIFDKSPLLLAISNDFIGVVEILMKADRKVNCFDDSKLTALHAAVNYGSKNVLEMLLNVNFNINGKSKNDYTPLHFAVDNNRIEIAKTLIQKKCDIDPICTRNQTPLCLAVQINKEMVDLLLANGANINHNKGTPLKLAILAGHKDILETLLSHKKINLKFTDSDNFTFLHYAALYGCKYLAEALLKKEIIDVDALETNDHLTPLLIATLKNHKDIIEVLLANNANANVQYDDSDTLLHKAVLLGGTDVVSLLINAGANSNIRNKANILPIELAVENGNLSIVKILLEFTNINVVGIFDFTMLHIAAQEDHLEIAKYLIEKGADVNARDNQRSKPIHIAAVKGSKKVLQYLFNTTDSLNDYSVQRRNLLHFAAAGGQLEIVKYLMDKQFDINLPDMLGCTALNYAAIADSKEVVEILLKNGANYKSAFNKKSMKAISNEGIIRLLTITDRLHESVSNNNLLKVKSCIDNGAILNCKNVDNVTALHQASCKGYETIVDILLKHEANPNMLGKGGCTPLHYAAHFGHVGIVQKLLSHGAIYDVKSDKNKIPFDLTKDQGTIDLLKLVDESFKSVQNGNSKIIDELNQIKDIHIAKAVMNACNNENKTLIVVAIQNNFPKIEELKEVFQDNDVATYISKAENMKIKEEFEGAFEIYKIILDKRRNIFGPNDPVILEIQDELACLLYKQQNYTKALKLYEEIYEKRQKILGVNNKDTLNTRSQIALILHRLGKSGEALVIFKEVLKMQSNLLGPNNIDVLITESRMAIVLDEIGKYDEALEINYKNYEKYKEKFGISHPSTLISHNNIATTLNKQGRTKEALKLYRNVYERMKICFGPAHSDTLKALHNIGGILTTQQKFDKALKLYETLYKLQKTCVPPWHPNTLRTLFTVANILTYQGKFYEAMNFFKELFRHGDSILGAHHPCIVESLKNMKRIEDICKIDGPESLKQFQYVNSVINKAAATGNINLIQKLLINGEDVNTADSEGRTPLYFACSNNHTHTVLFLLENNADVTRKTNKGSTPLHITSSIGNKEITEILLLRVKQTHNERLVYFLDAKTNTGGSTALHIAVRGDFEDVVKILIEYGATYDLTNNNNEMPSDLCTGKNLTDLFKLINELFEHAKTGNQSIINKLQVLKREDYIAIMNARNKQGNTLLQVAIVNKHKDVVRKLVELLKA